MDQSAAKGIAFITTGFLVSLFYYTVFIGGPLYVYGAVLVYRSDYPMEETTLDISSTDSLVAVNGWLNGAGVRAESMIHVKSFAYGLLISRIEVDHAKRWQFGIEI